MKKITCLSVFLCFLSFSWTVIAAEYYVAPHGSSSGGGSKSNPWNLAKANQSLQAGDTAILLDGDYNDVTIEPIRSGEADNPIVYRAEHEHKAVFSDTKSPDAPTLTAILLHDRAYITVEGVKSVNVNRWCRGDRSSHISLVNCHFEKGRGWSNCRFDESGGGNHIVGCYFSGGSDLLSIDGGDGHLVEDCFFGDATHSGLVFLGVQRSFARGNRMANRNWRCMEVESQRHEPYRKSMYNVIEENTFDYSPVLALQYAGNNSILRRNVFRRCMSGMGWANYLGRAKTPEAWHDEHNRFYNNVVAECGCNDVVVALIKEAEGDGYTVEEYIAEEGFGMSFRTNMFNPSLPDYTDCAFGDNIVVNNAFYMNRNTIELTDKGGKRASTTSQIGFDWNASPEFCRFFGNLFFSGVQNADAFYFNDAAYLDPPEPRNRSASGFDARYPDWSRANTDADPLFVDPQSGNFMLKAGSPCIDSGVHLTETVTGGSGTSIQVKDALFFTDGFGLIAPDSIRVGGRPAKIEAVDFDTNTLIVTKPVSWSAGDPVSLDYKGRAPDIGLYEFE